MRLLTIYVLLLVSCHTVYSQQGTSEQQYTISALIIDSISMKPMPFVSVYKLRDKNGTISNFNGNFVLEGVLLNDTIVFSYTGYEKKHIAAVDAIEHDTISLLAEAQLIDKVVVLADNSMLYDLISKCQKTKMRDKRTAKTYLELRSFQRNKQVELYEAYYNGSFKGFEITGLEMKNARLTFAPISKRLISTSADISTQIVKYDLFGESSLFPYSPFNLGKRELKAIYKLHLLKKYYNDNDRTIYVINFDPRHDDNIFFNGTVWIDSLSNEIVKVKLEIKDTFRYPFTSFYGSLNEVNNVDLSITRTYQHGKKHQMQLQSVNYSYAYDYSRKVDSILGGQNIPGLDSTFRVSAEAILYIYDYEHKFILPYFNFTESRFTDFIKMNAIQDNPAFWHCLREFKASSDQAKNELFMSDSTNVSGKVLLGSKANKFQGNWSSLNFLPGEYINWHKAKRVRLWDLGKRVTPRDSTVEIIDYYNLDVQIFLDVNEVCDSIQVITRTMFDPFNTYYRYPMTVESDAFVNIYFDLMEIQRRKLDAQIRKCGNNTVKIGRTYNKFIEDSKSLAFKYFRAVDRGTNREELKWWNDLVLKELDIDNFAIYGLYEAPSE